MKHVHSVHLQLLLRHIAAVLRPQARYPLTDCPRASTVTREDTRKTDTLDTLGHPHGLCRWISAAPLASDLAMYPRIVWHSHEE